MGFYKTRLQLSSTPRIAPSWQALFPKAQPFAQKRKAKALIRRTGPHARRGVLVVVPRSRPSVSSYGSSLASTLAPASCASVRKQFPLQLNCCACSACTVPPPPRMCVEGMPQKQVTRPKVPRRQFLYRTVFSVPCRQREPTKTPMSACPAYIVPGQPGSKSRTEPVL